MRKRLCIMMNFIMLAALAGCGGFKDLRAPCAYDARANCGPLVSMQQGVNQ